MHTDIKVGLACNNSCIHCIMHPVVASKLKGKHELNSSTADILEQINLAAANGYPSITLTGGEISIRPDFLILLEHALSLGLNTTVQTNGRLLSNSALIHDISNLNHEKLSFVVALHGQNAQIHDAITRKQGSFTETQKAISLLRKSNLNVIGKLVISKVNSAHLESTMIQFSQLGISEVLIAFPHAEDFSKQRFFMVVPKYTDIQHSILSAWAQGIKTKSKIEFETIPFCVLSDSHLWSGNVDLRHSLQEKETLSTVIKMPIENTSIDWRISRKEIKYKGTKCSGCLFDKICEGPWKEYFKYYGFDEFKPITDISMVRDFLNNL